MIDPDADRPAPAPARSRLAYPEDGGRDRRLDLLRGYALAAMSINHFGLSNSYLHTLSGRSQFLVSAAEAFLFISGFTLGYITIGRTPEQSTDRLSRRTWTVYLSTVGVSVGLGIVALTTNLLLWGELEAGAYPSVWAWLGGVVTMREAFNGADILIAYVVYLAIAIAALRLMTRGRSWVVITGTVGVYLLSRLAGAESMTLGFASFRALAPNAPLFFGGLLLGYHRHRVAALWHAVPGRRALDAALVVAAVALGWLYSQGWPATEWLGRPIAGPELSSPLGLREFEMPVVPLLVVFLYLRVGWIVVDALWVPIRSTLGWLFLPLGEASLFTFIMHLLAIPIVINLPWWPDEDLGRPAATFWVMLYLGVIYGAVLLRHRIVDWLRSGSVGGASGAAGSGSPVAAAKAWTRRHGPAATVAGLLVLAALVGGSPSGAAGTWGAFEDGEFEDGEFEDEEFEEPED
ncbi:MAG: OpgC domain-containing protein [Actinomycetota bacterium]